MKKWNAGLPDGTSTFTSQRWLNGLRNMKARPEGFSLFSTELLYAGIGAFGESRDECRERIDTGKFDPEFDLEAYDLYGDIIFVMVAEKARRNANKQKAHWAN